MNLKKSLSESSLTQLNIETLEFHLETVFKYSVLFSLFFSLTFDEKSIPDFKNLTFQLFDQKHCEI